MTDDRFMHSLRREPRPELSRSLWARLSHGADAADAEASERHRRFGLMPALAVAAALAIVSLFVFPSVRASAQAFLDLFRVRTFAAVNVDPARLQQLQSEKLDLKKLIGDRVQTLQEPGQPKPYASAGLAGAAAGMIVRTPSWLPAGFAADTVWVQGEGRMKITGDAQRLGALMQTLDVHDLTVPPGVDGAVIDVHAYPAVRQTFRSGDKRAMLVEARSPEVSLPAGLDLARLGEIGLRLLGLPASDARRIAASTDWRSTLVVPVPTNAASFQQVVVNGQPALLIREAPGTRKDGTPRRGGTLLMWSQGDEVFAVGGQLEKEDLLQMAQSVH